jgi:hypothetical protein
VKILCPICKREVPAGQVNISTDLMLCPGCNEGFKVSDAVDINPANPDALRHPPPGAWFRSEKDTVIFGATTRSPAAFYLVPFACVCSWFVLVGIYGSHIVKGQFDLKAFLLGIPFVIAIVVLWATVLMVICGKVELHIRRSDSRVFVGVWTLGWTRRFDWSAVRVIREEIATPSSPNTEGFAIVLEGKERLMFGTRLNNTRRRFVLNALKCVRAEKN